jgi:hypothetical protein
LIIFERQKILLALFILINLRELIQLFVTSFSSAAFFVRQKRASLVAFLLTKIVSLSKAFHFYLG